MSRQEHIQWCKNRALKYVDNGDLQDAYASMTSDLLKHPETKKHTAILVGMQMMMGGMLNNPDEMRNFIEGFN